MKLKAMLLAGVVCLAGAVTSSAQTVFSANTVGFVNKDIPTGFSMISNPVFAADNTLEALFPSPPLNTQIFKFDPVAGTFSIFDFTDFGGLVQDPIWFPSGGMLIPGEGAFISNPDAQYTVTFAGEVGQGATLNTVGNGSNLEIGMGFSIISSVVAQSGTLDGDLGFPSALGDQVFQFDPAGNSYNIFDYTDFDGLIQDPIWFPEDPTIAVAESFFVNKTTASDWDRNFDPNATN